MYYNTKKNEESRKISQKETETLNHQDSYQVLLDYQKRLLEDEVYFMREKEKDLVRN